MPGLSYFHGHSSIDLLYLAICYDPWMPIFLFAILTLGFPAEAALRLHCWSTVWEKESLGPAVVETTESSLVFKPIPGGEYRADVDAEFAQIPKNVFKFSVYESIKGQRLAWSSKILQFSKDSKKIRRKGRNYLEWETDLRTYRVECDAYDRTLSLKPDPSPKTTREKWRQIYIHGGGPAKEYLRGDKDRTNRLKQQNEDGQIVWQMDPLESMDLMDQLLATDLPLSEFLRKVHKRLGPFNPSKFSGEVHVGTADPACDCEYEDFMIRYIVDGVSMELMDAHTPSEFGGLEVLGTIVRGKKDRLIREYRIREVRVDHPFEIDGGGGSSTSGGRVNGQ